ncbi:ATP-dependent Clp protease ATP-binding subunit ClpC [Sporanaerobium hydrogeniformans]|uniref:ATP-dependent Clp protease ATP-binding subunit ClpC n=1 Tax=Sporanaerobium hydrogeniformans TaxID=3072179 RepID=A0AC61D9V5_9FIRM|nr:ATP-dependent Clp protease ATP-binding subunit [Sporanaerobium hydrogeniformans]PHV69822.1 ATP-dependent Clp protease ATP-binding subunit ClpC [Sporanaerobium hydrogeniformans]
MEIRFTKQAQIAIEYAEQVMTQFGHGYLGTEHLLVGLIHANDSVAQKAIEDYGLTEEDLLERIRDVIGIGSVTLVHGRDFTPRVKRIFETSAQLARQLGTAAIGTEYLLVSILKEKTCVAVKLLESLGVNTTKLSNSLIEMLMGNSQKPEASFSSTKQTNQVGKSTTPTLDKYSRDLTQLAREERFDPIIGREMEIERVIQILSRRTKNNPCLVGEPGVGKTAVVEGLAQKIVAGTIPELLKDRRVVSLDLSSMISGTKYRGEFEERINKVLDEVRAAKDIILFIDELHTIIGAGAAEGAMDASNILKPSLARGEIQLVGATTLDEYRKHIEKDAALERRFQPVQVEEPSEDETLAILKGIKDKYEVHHQVQITEDALEAAVKLSSRYIADRYLPDKAIDLLDEAASKVRLRAYTSPTNVKELEAELLKLNKDKEEAIINEEYEKAGQIKQKENLVKEKIANAKMEWETKHTKSSQIVSEEEIADVVSTWTHIPVKRLAEEEYERLQNLEKILHERVIGQDEAIKAVSKAVRRGRVGLKDPNRPIGSFLFLGPTGVGKTELTKTLAEAMFGDENTMIRIDMSEYMEKHTVSKLIGSPPGYVGYEEGGQLTEKVRRKPYSVVLFDEIEKAHSDVFNILLQILDDGHITDSRGRKINFKNTIIIMTSNIGARNIIEPKKLGFISNEDAEKSYQDMKKGVMEEVKRLFRPEFLNRIDELLVFHPLTTENIRSIADVMIKNLLKRISKNIGIELELTEEALEFLAKKGYDKTYGARPLRRTIQTYIEDKLSDEILEGKVKEGDTLKVSLEGENFLFTRQ